MIDPMPSEMQRALLEFQALMMARDRDAARYRWIRQRGAWETEAVLNGLTPEQYDAAVDAAMKEAKP